MPHPFLYLRFHFSLHLSEDALLKKLICAHQESKALPIVAKTFIDKSFHLFIQVALFHLPEG